MGARWLKFLCNDADNEGLVFFFKTDLEASRSNGGLLVGACMAQCPDLFGAALPAVGVLDMPAISPVYDRLGMEERLRFER